jgi:hypothetical protein
VDLLAPVARRPLELAATRSDGERPTHSRTREPNPVRHRRRGDARPLADRCLAGPRLRGRDRLRPVPGLPAGGVAGARRGVAAARCHARAGTAGRPGHRHEVPHLLRSASGQGRLARASTPRCLRAVWHVVQRFCTHRTRRGAAQAPHRSRHAHARRVHGALQHRAHGVGPARALQRSDRGAALPSAAACRRVAGWPLWRLHRHGHTAGEGQARRPGDRGVPARDTASAPRRDR